MWSTPQEMGMQIMKVKQQRDCPWSEEGDGNQRLSFLALLNH